MVVMGGDSNTDEISTVVAVTCSIDIADCDKGLDDDAEMEGEQTSVVAEVISGRGAVENRNVDGVGEGSGSPERGVNVKSSSGLVQLSQSVCHSWNSGSASSLHTGEEREKHNSETWEIGTVKHGELGQ